MNTKKKWLKPQLIILERSTSEENVLAACKGGSRTGPDASGCTSSQASGKCNSIKLS